MRGLAWPVRTGLTGIAVSLPPERGDPAELTPAGRAGSRVDRHYATEELAAAAGGYRKLATGGSGHDMSMVICNQAVLASAVPPGPGDRPRDHEAAYVISTFLVRSIDFPW
jgi:hypothetical protein